jgi:predicted aldo/keto reductase-like oxidoreductase
MHERRQAAGSAGHHARSGVSRRMFLELSVVGAVAAGAARLGVAQETRADGIPYRTLGRTGEKVSLVGVGGAHLGWLDDAQEAVRIVRTALDSGINFMDNSWDYSDGRSEERMGKALRDGYRQRAFLMTKIDGRTKQSAARQLDESLRRLQTDRLDLLQFHEIIRMTDADRIFAPGGALEAALAAKQAGKVRFLGFTGHKSPEIHLHMLETAAAHQFTFDTVQMPLNVMDAHFHSFGDRVLPVALSRHMGVLAMKPMGDHHILDSQAVTPVECLHYAMNLPVSVVITGCDSLAILRQAIDAAKDFRPLDAARLAALRGKTARAAENGRYELYKTSDHFDSTAHHPEWLG